jgi:hypothetical protein
MKEALDNARDELKRVDHLYYVSLKYTRTVDVIKHIIDRMISTFSFGIESMLKYAKEKKMIIEIPANGAIRCKLLTDIFTNQEIKEYVNFYLKLRKIARAKYGKREEYRRHVTMIAAIDNGEIVEVSIDVLKDYYETSKNFVNYVKSVIDEEKET